jgi:precorrin-6A/cobalt-precorrin-6A reductase
VLGGTHEARELADRLRVLPEVSFDLSLAREGGFGGVDGLADYLRSGAFDALVDATHPFATVITAHAIAAATESGLPLLLLQRPGWAEGPGDDWHRVPNFAAAAEALAELEPQTVFLAIGRKELTAFGTDSRHHYLLRMIEPPAVDVLLPRHSLLLDRGPFGAAAEESLLRSNGVGVVVTKDSGGVGAAAKLVAARTLSLPVVIIDRPPPPALPVGIRVVESVSAALGWLLSSSR